PQQIALNDPLEASRAATAASLSSDRFRHRESISSCLPFSTVTQPALVLFPNQIRIYSQQAPRPAPRLATNLLRYFPTIPFETLNSDATSLLLLPLAHSKTIRARCANAWALVLRRVHDS